MGMELFWLVSNEEGGSEKGKVVGGVPGPVLGGADQLGPPIAGQGEGEDEVTGSGIVIVPIFVVIVS